MMPEPKIDKHPVSPDETHVKDLVWERIIVKNGVPYYQKWFFKQEDFACGRCHVSRNTVFMALPTGVYRSCEQCGYTEGIDPVDFDTHEELAILLEEKTLSVAEAWEVVDKHKQKAPAGLVRPKGKRRRLEE